MKRPSTSAKSNIDRMREQINAAAKAVMKRCPEVEVVLVPRPKVRKVQVREGR